MQHELERLGTTPLAVDGRDRCWPPNLYAAHRPTSPVAQAKTRRIAIVFRQRSDRVLVCQSKPDVPSDPAERVDTLAQFIWAQACSGKFVWPIADRGFNKHAHRIAAPTLIVWDKADGIIAPAYAQEFARRISGARVELIDAAGHLPHLERPETVIKTVRAFLGG
jgi:pimeloyl-ACP methyl ester carboxylesterase